MSRSILNQPPRLADTNTGLQDYHCINLSAQLHAIADQIAQCGVDHYTGVTHYEGELPRVYLRREVWNRLFQGRQAEVQRHKGELSRVIVRVEGIEFVKLEGQ